MSYPHSAQRPRSEPPGKGSNHGRTVPMSVERLLDALVERLLLDQHEVTVEARSQPSNLKTDR